MKHIIIILFLMVIGIKFLDGADSTKAVLVLTYDNGIEDKIVVDKKTLKQNVSYIGQLVNKLLISRGI